MARLQNRLSARAVATIAEPGRHADGGGLYLVVARGGSRNWVFLFQRNGKAREMGLGSVSAVSLAQARQKAAQARQMLADDVDPLEARKAAVAAATAAATTFGQFADEFIKVQRPSWSNAVHAKQWVMTLGDAYCRDLRRRPIGEVGLDDVLGVLSPIWQAKPETARRIRMRLEKVLDAAKVRGLRSGENPARLRGNLDHLLPKHRKDQKAHHAAMNWGDVPAFAQGLRDRAGTAALALRFTIATAARTGEVIGATWDEIDLEARLWTVPAERMKARRPHRVPLNDEALAALEAARSLSPTIVFPGPSLRRPLSNMAMAAILKRDGLPITVHGFRSAFSDWAAETTAFPREAVEMALAHVISNATEAAYRRGDLFDKRRALMAAWSTFLSGTTVGNIVQIAGAR